MYNIRHIHHREGKPAMPSPLLEKFMRATGLKKDKSTVAIERRGIVRLLKKIDNASGTALLPLAEQLFDRTDHVIAMHTYGWEGYRDILKTIANASHAGKPLANLAAGDDLSKLLHPARTPADQRTAFKAIGLLSHAASLARDFFEDPAAEILEKRIHFAFETDCKELLCDSLDKNGGAFPASAHERLVQAAARGQASLLNTVFSKTQLDPDTSFQLENDRGKKRTLLFIATLYKQPLCVAVLLQNGSNPTLDDTEGMARIVKNEEISRLIGNAIAQRQTSTAAATPVASPAPAATPAPPDAEPTMTAADKKQLEARALDVFTKGVQKPVQTGRLRRR